MITVTVSAQNRGNRQVEYKSVNITGTLQLEKGFVAVKSGDSVYSIPLLNRYIGFIDGLKEGNTISLEGYEFRNFIHPVKATINEKSYDFSMGRNQGGSEFRNEHIRPENRNFSPGFNNPGQGRRNFEQNRSGCSCGHGRNNNKDRHHNHNHHKRGGGSGGNRQQRSGCGCTWM